MWWTSRIDNVSYDDPQFRIKNGEIREIQLSKARFGKGKWEINMKINAIKGSDGNYYTINFPEEGAYHVIEVE